MNQGTLRDGLISSPGGSRDNPASLFPMQENEKGLTTAVTSGRRCLQLSESLNRPLSLAKTLLASSVWRMARHLTVYSLTWRMKATRQNNLLFQLVPSEHGIEGIEFGSSALIPTITQSDVIMENVPLRKEVKEGVMHQLEGSGSLNPTWVEWLQGYPLNWTDIGTENLKESQELQSESKTELTDLKDSETQ